MAITNLKIFFSSLIYCLFFTQLSGQSSNNTIPSDTIFDGHVVNSLSDEHGITMGVNFDNYLYGEIGFFSSSVNRYEGSPILSAIFNSGLEFSYIDKLVLAPKIQFRLQYVILNASLSLLYYNDLSNLYSLKTRPEIGFSYYNFDINYGYNIGLMDGDLKQINGHVISLRYYLPLQVNLRHEYDRNGNLKPKK